jgi:hypothetical protein
MNVDLSRQEVELVIRRFNEAEQPDIDEQILVKKLRDHFPEEQKFPLRAYLKDFKHEPPIPPAPGE